MLIIPRPVLCVYSSVLLNQRAFSTVKPRERCADAEDSWQFKLIYSATTITISISIIIVETEIKHKNKSFQTMNNNDIIQLDLSARS